MQTKTRYSPARNPSTIEYPITRKRVCGRTARARRFECLNRAEYYIWAALRLGRIGFYVTVLDRQELQEKKAAARFWLRQAQTIQ